MNDALMVLSSLVTKYLRASKRKIEKNVFIFGCLITLYSIKMHIPSTLVTKYISQGLCGKVDRICLKLLVNPKNYMKTPNHSKTHDASSEKYQLPLIPFMVLNT